MCKYFQNSFEKCRPGTKSCAIRRNAERPDEPGESAGQGVQGVGGQPDTSLLHVGKLLAGLCPVRQDRFIIRGCLISQDFLLDLFREAKHSSDVVQHRLHLFAALQGRVVEAVQNWLWECCGHMSPWVGCCFGNEELHCGLRAKRADKPSEKDFSAEFPTKQASAQPT